MQDILSDAANKIKRFKEQLTSKQGQLNAEAQVQTSFRVADPPVCLQASGFSAFTKGLPAPLPSGLPYAKLLVIL